MTIAAALEAPAERQDANEVAENCEEDCRRVEFHDSKASDDGSHQSTTSRVVINRKRPIPTPLSSSAPVFKKSRAAVQRTHSPKTIPAPLQNPRLQKVTPTVLGIKEVSRHLLRSQSSALSPNEYSYVAIPTECTYEMCSLIKWNKRESLSSDDIAYREEELNQCKFFDPVVSIDGTHATYIPCLNIPLQFAVKRESSSSSVHVYLQHHNIKHIDRLLEFPKKTFATKQNPDVGCSFNESRLLFQKLADQFWPGPVHLYLPTQSFAPDGLLQSLFQKRRFIGFRCPSHPLTVKVLKQVYQEGGDPAVLVGAPVHHADSRLTKAKDVAIKFIQSPPSRNNSKVLILHGEERREIFAVPPSQFRDEWLECWIVTEKRTIVLKGKSKRDVIPQLKANLLNHSKKNRVISSILRHWRVDDQREK